MKAYLASVAFFLAIALVSCGPKPTLFETGTSLDRLQSSLNQLFNDPAFETATWGVVIQSLQSGEYLYRLNEDKGFMPASNMKLYTTAAALVKLGPDYRYCTTLLTTGTVTPGVLHGDLIIRGSGDPSITGRYHQDNPLAVFAAWADSLKKRGITRIDGRLIGDDNYFADEIMGNGWSWDYQSDWYAAQISALSFNDNCVDIRFFPARQVGQNASFELRPDTRYVQIINQVKTVRRGLAKGVYFSRQRAFNKVTITGSIEMGTTPKWDWFSVENPTQFATVVFREVLEKEGIAVSGPAFDIDSLKGFRYDPDSATILTRYFSPPLSDIITTINKVSQNLYAELLLRTLGKEFTDIGDAEHGIEVVKQVVSGFGIDPHRFGMVDGSGLSRLNLITPRQTSLLLWAMKNHRNGEVFYNSLPIAGVDGTIKNRMKGTAAENNVHAKTGYIGRARSLSGYVTTADGELLSFVMMVNNYMVPTTRANFIQDLVCERLAGFQRKQLFQDM